MKNLIALCFMYLYSSFILAHEANEAFFKITQKEHTIEVEAEFPWTMRDALLAYNPSLENSASKTDFENTFIEYIKANLILKNKSGENLAFQNYKEIDGGGHSHQNNYLIVFKGTNVSEVTNTMMFNVYENQVNFNTLTVNTQTFETSKASNSFKVNQSAESNNWYFLLLILPLLFLGYRFYKKA